MALTFKQALQHFWQQISLQFVHKETGKGLSTNDYTTADKNKVSSLPSTIGTITGVTAGSGLTGGGTSGSVTLDIAADRGLNISSDKIGHANSVTAGTAQGSATKTLTFGDTFTIPTVTYDAQGHITNKGTTTMTMPANPNVDTGATSVEVVGDGNAITTAAYNSSTRKLTLTKGATYNNYSLPNAGTSLGGVKNGGVATISSGLITAISEAAKVTNALTIKGNGTTAGTFNGSAATSVNIVGSGSASVTGASGSVTISVPEAIKNPKALKAGSKTYDGSSEITITAADLGLSSAMKFLGTSATAITDGATTNPITIGSTSTTAESGNVVLYGSKEFVWNGSAWEELGNEGSYKVVQEAVSSPSASGNATAFIDTISQDTNGKITVTKKNVNFPTLSGGSAAANDATIVGGTTVSGHAVTVNKKTLKAGSNVTITGGTSEITIAATDTTYGAATTSAAGLMSASDKQKLDGIASGATANTGTITGVTAGNGLSGGGTSGSVTLAVQTDRGLSIASDKVGHSNSVTAGTASGSSNKTLTFGDTFTIPSVTYDAYGHITGKGTTTMTMPANPSVAITNDEIDAICGQVLAQISEVSW